MEINLKFKEIMKLMHKKAKDQTLLVQMMLFFKNLINKTVFLIIGSLITTPKINL